LADLVESRNTPENADVLEVFQLCLFLGFHGRYGNDRLQLERFRSAVTQKIDQVRGVGRPLAPDWEHPAEEHVVGPRDPWLRSLAISATLVLILVGAAFVTYGLILTERTDDLRSMATQTVG
ncbi:MAG: DotU family type IV/VI secretion system protein, partial [Longimicrobiales bacterium]